MTVRVADPTLSPDGKLVAFVKTVTDPATLKRDADVWLVPADGSAPPRPLTRHEASDTSPRFSPDGRTLAFLSTRGGTSQVYLLDLSGERPEADRRSRWGRRAARLLARRKEGRVRRRRLPDCADEACNRKRFDEAEKGRSRRVA